MKFIRRSANLQVCLWAASGLGIDGVRLIGGIPSLRPAPNPSAYTDAHFARLAAKCSVEGEQVATSLDSKLGCAGASGHHLRGGARVKQRLSEPLGTAASSAGRRRTSPARPICSTGGFARRRTGAGLGRLLQADRGSRDADPTAVARAGAIAQAEPVRDGWSELSAVPEPEEHLAEEHAQASVDCLYDFLTRSASAMSPRRARSSTTTSTPSKPMRKSTSQVHQRPEGPDR